jgi:integrase
LAVRYDAIPRNPVPVTSRLRRPKPVVKALSFEEIQHIRAVVADWRTGDSLPGPRPDGQLGAIIEVMLGTSARIGEVLALRRCDVNVAGSPPTARICGTIIKPKGKPVQRQDHPKTEASKRRVALPSFAAEAVRKRLAVIAPGEEELLFQTRNGTPLTTNNVRRQLRAVLGAMGIEGVTPHAFRRTVATTIDREAGVDLASAMLGHSSRSITEEHYIEKSDLVDPRTAEVLELLAPDRFEETSSAPSSVD